MTSIIICNVLALLILCRCALPPQSTTIYQSSTDKFALKHVLVAPQSFTWNALLIEAKHHLANRGPQTLVEEVLFSPSKEELARSGFGTRMGEEGASIADTIQQGRQGFPREEAGLPTRGIARLLVIRNQALFTFRPPGVPMINKTGIRESVLSSKDPTRLIHGGRAYRILRIGISGNNPVAAYIKSDGDSSCAVCQEIALDLSNVLGEGKVDVQIRPDHWFASSTFPLLFRFEPDDGPGNYSDLWLRGLVVAPTVYNYYRKQHIFCNVRPANRFACEAYGLQERQSSSAVPQHGGDRRQGKARQ